MRRVRTYERSVFIPDLHVPYMDELAFSTAIAFIKEYKPHVIFVIGDVVDFYALSKYDKDPGRISGLQEELDEAWRVLARIRRAAPHARITYLYGNHEARLKKFLWRKAPELTSLRFLKLDELLHLKDLNIKPIESGVTNFHGMVVKHGNVVRNRSGYSATGELEKVGTSGISGHTHRLSQVFKTNYGGFYTWVESGCLCDLKPEYLEGQVADWQHGITYGLFAKHDTRFVLHPTPIIKGKLVFAGSDIRG